MSSFSSADGYLLICHLCLFLVLLRRHTHSYDSFAMLIPVGEACVMLPLSFKALFSRKRGVLLARGDRVETEDDIDQVSLVGILGERLVNIGRGLFRK
jgi:hypothetical protein